MSILVTFTAGLMASVPLRLAVIHASDLYRDHHAARRKQRRAHRITDDALHAWITNDPGRSDAAR